MHNSLKAYLPHILIFSAVLYLISKLGTVLKGNEYSQIKLGNDELFSESKSTLTLEASKLIADNFYNALAGESLGKNSSLLYAQFEKLKSQADFNKVYNVFGKRQYSRTFDNVGDPWTSDLLDLQQILAVEISAVEQEFIKNKYPHLTMF